MDKGMKSPGGQVRNPAEWRAVVDLFEARQYEQLGDLLHEVQGIRESQGDGIQAQILDAARQICLACGQSHSEIAWHQQASEAAEQREDELRQQLQTILSLVSEGDQFQDLDRVERAPDIPFRTKDLGDISESKPAEQTGIWQRIQTLLSIDLFSKLSKQPPSIVNNVKHTELIEQAEPVIASSEYRTTTPHLEEEGAAQLGTPSLVVYCLGPFRVYQDDQLITEWQTSKGKSIFKYLVTHRERPIAK